MRSTNAKDLSSGVTWLQYDTRVVLSKIHSGDHLDLASLLAPAKSDNLVTASA